MYTCKIDKHYTTDVAVIGGGPAGIAAALSAADNGMKVILIEQYGYVGGMASAGLVAPFMTSYDSGGNIRVIRGICDEIIARLIEHGGALEPSEIPAPSSFTSYITAGHNHVTPFDAESLKFVAEQMLVERGVKLLYHTSFIDTMAHDGHIDSVIIHNKSGFADIRAKVYIDCTGDADVAVSAGAEYELGNSGTMQPATMFFRIGNVDSARVDADIAEHINEFYRKDGVNYRSFHWHVSRAREAGDWTLKRVSIGLFRGVREDEWSVNTSRIMDVDGTDAESLTDASIIGREQVDEIFKFIVKYIPGCENARLLCSASQVGIRETRHIKGLKKLTAEELVACVPPDDSVLLAASSIDIHGKFGPLSNQAVIMPEGRAYGIPYGTLVPEGLDNLLVAGRCISAESDAAGAIRVMPPCMGTGQAAGAAAAQAVSRECTVPDVDVALLRETLKSQNVYLG